MVDNTPRYIVNFSDGNYSRLTEAEYNEVKDQLHKADKNASVARINDLSADEPDEKASYVVSFDDGNYSILTPQQYAEAKDGLSRAKGVRVNSLSAVDYWGDKLRELDERKRQLEEERQGLPAPVDDIPSDPRAIQGENALSSVYQERRESPERKRRAEIDRELEMIGKERENNPAWQRYWEGERNDATESIARVAQMRQDAKRRIKEGDNLSLRDPEILNAAENLYKDALKTASAPSKYGDDNQLAQYWQGVKDNAWDAISVVSLVKALGNIPLMETVKQIQRNEGNDVNILDLVQNHSDRLTYLSDPERELMRAFVKKAEVEAGRDDLSVGYKAGQSSIQSVGFMADFLMMGGGAGMLADKVAGKAVESAAKKAAAKGLTKTAGTITADALHGLVKAAALSPMMPSTYSNILNNLAQFNDAGGVDLSTKAVAKAVGDAFIENVSETIGAKPLEYLGWGVGKALPVDWMSKTKFGSWGKAMRHSPWFNAMKQAGWNGFVEEMFEEVSGNALRVWTGIDEDALRNFMKPEEFLTTAAAFAPMSLVGGGVSTVQYGVASKQMKDAGVKLADLNIDEATLNEYLGSIRDAQTPQEVGSKLGALYNTAVNNGSDPAATMKALQDYAFAAGKYKAMEGIYEEQQDVDRTNRALEISAQYGDNWSHKTDEGTFVRTLTDQQGNTFYVTNQDEKGFAAVGPDGSTHFVDNAEVENGDYIDSGDTPINDYLDGSVRQQEQQREAVRMEEEKQSAENELYQTAQPGTEINFGSVENPETGVILGMEAGQYIVQKASGAVEAVTPEEIANKLNISLTPQTDEEIEAEEVRKEEDIINKVKSINAGQVNLDRFKGISGDFNRIIRADDGRMNLIYSDEEGQKMLDITPEDLDELAVRVQDRVQEVEAPAADNTPRDYKGEPLPMRTNKVTGEQVVDETTLWNRDPKAWAAWNDTNPSAKVGTKEKLEYNITALGKEIEKDTKELRKAALSGVDADEMDKMDYNLQQKQLRLKSLIDVLNEYNLPVAANQTAAGEQRKAKAEKVKEEQKAGFPGIQQKWNNADKIVGAPDEIRLPNGEIVTGNYVLTESDAPTASHNPSEGFKRTDGFPVDENGKTVNDRDYEHDAQAQKSVLEKAASYDQRALQTPVIVSPDGVVLSGNDRTMASQLAAANNTDKAYTDYLEKYSQKYGFSKEQVNSFEHPRVVFVPSIEMAYNAANFAKFNAEEKKSQSKTEKAVKAGKTLTPQTLGALATLVDQYDDINALYNSPEGVDELLNILLAGEVISQEQVASLKDGNTLSGTGMDMLESTLIGAALDEEAVRIAMSDKSIRKSVVSAVSQIITGNTLQGYTLRTELSDAIALVSNGKKEGLIKTGESVQGYIRQGNLFGGDVVAEATVQMLADAVNSKKTSLLKNVLSLYNRDAVESANGQMSILTNDVPTREAILQQILEYLGYGTQIFKPAAEAAAEAGGTETETGEAGPVVQSNEGSAVDRDEAYAVLEEGGVGELIDYMTDDEVARFLQLMSDFQPYNDALGQAYTDLKEELKSKDEEVKKAAQAKIDELEKAQVEAYQPVQDYVQSILEKYNLADEVGMQPEENFDDEEEEKVEVVKKSKNKKEKAEKRESVFSGKHTKEELAKANYTSDEVEQLIYGASLFGEYTSKKTGEKIEIVYADDKMLVYHDHQIRFWIWQKGDAYGDKAEAVATTDFMMRYLKLNGFKLENPSAKKNKYGYWVNKHGVIANPIRIELPSVRKGWAQQNDAEFGQREDGKWVVGYSYHFGEKDGYGGIGSPCSVNTKETFDTKSDAIKFAIKVFEHAVARVKDSKSWESKDVRNLLNTLKSKTLPQALLEEGALNTFPHTEITAYQLDNGVQGDLFGEVAPVGTIAEEQPSKPKKTKKAAKPKAKKVEEGNLLEGVEEVIETGYEDEDEEKEPEIAYEAEEGTPGNYHWPEERICTNPTIITLPGADKLGHVNKVAIAEKNGEWYYDTYVCVDGNKGASWGSPLPSFKSNYIPYKSREKALESAISYIRFIMAEPGAKQANKFGFTFNEAKELIDYIVKMEIPQGEVAPEVKQASMEDALDNLKKALGTNNPARVTNVLNAYKGSLDEETNEKIDSILTKFRTAGVTKQSKEELVKDARALYNELTGTEEVETPVQETKPVEKHVEKPVYGSENKIITTDKYEELKARMKEKLGQLNAGFDPEVFFIGAQMAAYHVEAGARKFVDFAQRMISDLGDAIRPYLKAIYNGARDLPGMEEFKKEMDSAAEVENIDVDSIQMEAPVEEAAADTNEATEEAVKTTPAGFKVGEKFEYTIPADGTNYVHTVEVKDIKDGLVYYHVGLVTDDERLAREAEEDAIKPIDEFDSEFLEVKIPEYERQVQFLREQEAKQGEVEATEPVVKEVDVNGLLGGINALARGKKEEVKLSDYAKPVEAEETLAEESNTLGELGKYTHTKTGKEMSIVRLTGERLSSDEFKQLKARAKKYRGYYSSYGSSKGFLFDNEEDAVKFNTIEQNERTDKQTAADTAAIVSKAASVAIEAESLAEAESIERGKAEELVSKIDDALEEVNDQLALLGYYDAYQNSEFDESYGYMKSAEKKAVKDADKLAKRLAKDLGIEVGRKQLAKANIAPAGGDVTFRLPLNEGRELYVDIHLEPTANDSLTIGGRQYLAIMYRVENPSASGMERFGSNHSAPYDVSYDDLLKRIRYVAKDFLPEQKDILQVVKEQAEKSRKSPKKEVSSPVEGDNLLGGLFDVLTTEEPGEPVIDTPEEGVVTEVNGFKKGDKVIYTGDGKAVEATIYDFERDGRPVLDAGLAHVLYEVTDWENIKPIENGSERNDGIRPEGLQADDSGQAGDSEAAEAGNGEEALQESEPVNAGGTAESGLHSEPGRSLRRVPRLSGQNKRNNRVSKGEVVYPKSPAARYRANIEAIKLLKDLQDSGKQATKEQMGVLRQYTGWGGLGTYFNNEYTPEHRELKSLLTDEEMNAAEMSINTAYYTPVGVIDAMWEIAKRLGFEGGNILEGSAGIGNILASMPKNISDQSAITAVELDNITGGILEQLYPDANVLVKGFEKADIPNNSIDLAITNVPFGANIQVYDEMEKDLTRKFGGAIHDFCIAKNVRKLKEGGIGIFISSKGTLDNATKSLRQWIVNEGNSDVIGAFRLNNKTFEGTGATSDIIVIRKRVNNKPYPGAINVTDTDITRREDYETDEREWNPKTRAYEFVRGKAVMELNEYFVEHPENMGGVMGFGFEHNDTYRPSSVACWPAEKIDQDKRLNKWAKSFVEIEDEPVAETPVEENETTSVKEGQLVVNSKGEICASRKGKAVPLGINAQKVKGYTKAQCLNDYNALKAAIDEALDYQLKNESDEGLKPLLNNLNKAYDTFVRKYGHLNKNVAISFLRNDVDFAATAAVENYKEEKSIDGKVKAVVKKTGIFNGRVLGMKRVPTPKDAKDGVIVSMNQFGRIDIPFIAKALNKGEAEVKEEILSSGLGFENPQTGEVEVEYEYLSGNVRQKLDYAKNHNEDGKYDNNIKALEKVIPADIPAHLIEFSLGSDWLPTDLYSQYAREKFDVNEEFVPKNLGGVWTVPERGWYGENNEKNRSAGVRSEKLGMQKYGHELYLSAMNNKPIVFSKTYKDYDGVTHTEHDPSATQAATAKMADMRDDFKEWCRAKMLAEPELSAQISKTYNDTFNAFVPKEIRDIFVPERFDGQVLEMGGKPFHLRPHQSKAVIRSTTEPLMLAHEVGSGKTFTLISAAMEMKRLGTAKKPMIVVQNSTLGQFVSSSKALYPNAKVLTISERDRTAEGRSAFYAKIKYNDWDIIIIPQSVFDMMPDSEERKRAFLQEKIEEKKFIIEQAKMAKNDGAVRQLKQELEDLEYERDFGEPRPKKNSKKQAEALNNAKVKAQKQLDRRTDEVSDFDDMGIDALLVDEAHAYKHLGFSTSMQRGVKGVDPNGSKRAAGVYLKTRSVFDKVGWKNVVFATGTPISNTAAEIWTFMKYLMTPDAMRENHIYYFDDFVRNFGNITQNLEFTTSGKFKETTRFSSYTNLPELVRIWWQTTDVVLSKDAVAATDAEGNVKKLEDELPKMEDWKDDKGEHKNSAKDIYLPQSPSLVDIMTAIRKKLEWYEGLSGKEKKEYNYIPLKMFGLAKMAAIDPRLVDRNAADEPNSKTNQVVAEVLKALEDSKKYKGTAALFSDNFRRWDEENGKRYEGFNLFDEIKRKLVEAGVPEEQIVIMKSGMTTQAKEKIFQRVNDGDVRVIMGTTDTLGTGVNIQERLFFVSHIDAPNRPMDYTQRNGRILRQGNLHKDWNIPVRVVRFGVEDSLDVTAYQRLSTKAKFINSVMDGKPLLADGMDNRVLEEEEEGEFDNPVAVLSGSEYAMLKSNAERELRKLKNRKEQHRQDQIYIEKTLKENANRITYDKKLIEEDKAYLDKVHNEYPDGKVKQIVIDGSKSADINTLIKDKLITPLRAQVEKRRYERGFTNETLEYIFKFDSIPTTVNVKIMREEVYDDKKHEYRPEMRTLLTYTCKQLGFEDRLVPGGYSAIKDVVTDFVTNFATGKIYEQAISNLESNIARKESDNALMLERRGNPFADEEKLQKQEELVKDYTEKMKAEMAAKEAKYKELANVSTNFNLDAVEVEEEDEEEHDRPATDVEKLNISDPLVLAEAAAAVNRLAKKLNLQVKFDDTLESKGAYSEKNGIRINIANCESVDDALETLLHEGVGHYGLRQLLGKDGMSEFVDYLLENATNNIKQRIEEIAQEQGKSMAYAAEEYVAELAEKTDYTRSERSLWRKIIDFIRNVFDTITGRQNRITDDTIREMLVSSYRNLEKDAILSMRDRQKGESAMEFYDRSVNNLNDRYTAIVETKAQPASDNDGEYDPESKEISIFADDEASKFWEVENSFFHENYHAAEDVLSIPVETRAKFIEEIKNFVKPEIFSMYDQAVKENYDADSYQEELAACLFAELAQGPSAKDFIDIASDEVSKQIDTIFNKLGYEYEREREERSRTETPGELWSGQGKGEVRDELQVRDEESEEEVELSSDEAETGSRSIAADILFRYDEQDGDKYPWMNTSDVIREIEEKLPYEADTEFLFGLIDRYNRMDAEDFDEGRRDFSGAEKEETFGDILAELRAYAKNVPGRNRPAGVEGFISNAEHAVKEIRMEKATPEQWKNMLVGKGLKAAEDKWIGLTDWLDNLDQKTVSKKEVLDYIKENRIQIEEEHYTDADNIPMGGDKEWDSIVKKHFGREVFDAFRFYPGDGGTASEFVDEDVAAKVYRKLQKEYGYDYIISTPRGGEYYSGLDLIAMKKIANRIAEYGDNKVNEKYGKTIHDTRIGYTTDGLNNKREIALTIPTIEPWNANDDIHFGDAGEGRAIAWVRFGDTSLSNEYEQAKADAEAASKANFGYLRELREKYGVEKNSELKDKMTDEEREKSRELFDDWNTKAGATAYPQNFSSDSKVLFIDEIQSKRHQEGREKGYTEPGLFNDAVIGLYEVRELASGRKIESAPITSKSGEVIGTMNRTGDGYYFGELANGWETSALPTESMILNQLGILNARGVMPAPFEKNWHELAMKRMLRLAAEEGYDYVAWTTGEQQAERYNLGDVVETIRNEGKSKSSGLTSISIRLKNGDMFAVDVDDDGAVKNRYDSYNEPVSLGEYDGKNLGDIIGKELAVRALSLSKYGKIEGDGLRIGGEGMRGFYDDILPRFMNKYGKKWGVSVEDIELPQLNDETGHPLVVHAVKVTPEMKESVLQGQMMFREGRERLESPVSYSESMGAMRLAVNKTADQCGIKVEFRPASEMKFGDMKLAGRWINGRMLICLENMRDVEDAVKTVLHEGVGHNGLRKLIGNENMTAFCLDVYNSLGNEAKGEILTSAIDKYNMNIVEATEEYLARKAEDNNFGDSLWARVRFALRKLLAKIGIRVNLNENDVRWLLWQSYNANKQSDVLNEAKRQMVAKNLGFTLRQQSEKVHSLDIVRNRESVVSAARLYNKDVMNWMNRLHETWVDKDDSVKRLVEAVEKSSGKKAKAFEDIRLSLNQQSSKGLAAIQKFEREHYDKMADEVKKIVNDGHSLKEVERYVMLKHALERNDVFAKRDALDFYKTEHDVKVSLIKDSDKIDDLTKLDLIAKEDAKFERHKKAVEEGTDPKYKENRNQDYGGLTAMFSEFDPIEPFNEGVESNEEYQARVLQARHPKYTYIDADGVERVDMPATEKAAEEEVKDFESKVNVDNLWKEINGATKATLKHQYDANMLSKEQYNHVKDMFKYYVPLRGFAENTAEDMYDYYNSDQRRTFTPPLVVARGRKTEAESPFGYIGAMASSAIAADMKNETKLALYYFISNRPDNDLVNISDVWYKNTGIDEVTGKRIFTPVYPPFKEDLSSEEAKKAYREWEENMEKEAKAGFAFKSLKKLDLHNSVIHIDENQKDSHVIKFKVGGKDKMMYINGNPRAAQAINNELNVEMSSDYQKVFGKVLRWFSGINTSYNPEFWLSNAQRDALFALMGVNVKEDAEYNKEFRKNFGEILRNTLTPGNKGANSLRKRLESGELGNDKLDRYYKEFVENGGVTGYTTLKNNEEWEQQIRNHTGKDKATLSAIKHLFETIQGFGESIEQMTRFAAYMTSRNEGKDIKDSVNDAKELTVNFNRKGSGKAISFKEADRLRTKDGKPLTLAQKAFVVGASWLPVYGRRFIIFFNASVQGLNALYKLFKKNPARMGTWAAGYLTLGVINAVLHSMLDDDDDYLDIPDYERRNNLLVGGNGVYFKWALPQEARVFYAMGDMAVNHLLGREPHKGMLGEVLSAASDIAPLNPAGGVSALAPSALSPVVEVVMNRDYKGAKIYNDLRYLTREERKRTPAYKQAYQGTGKLYTLASEGLNWLTGGDYADAGWLNINPAVVEHLLQGATGGAGTTIGKLYRGTIGQAFGEDFVVRNTPFLSRLLTVTDDRYRNAHTTELFDYYKAEAEHTRKLIRQYAKDGEDKKLDRIYDSRDFEIMLVYESYKGLLNYYSEELRITDDKSERRELMKEQDAIRKEMIKEISEK